MVKLIENPYFIDYALHIVNLNLIQDLNSDFYSLIEFVCCLKYFAESTFTDEMGFFIEDVVIAEFFHTLVDVSFILFDLDW